MLALENKWIWDFWTVRNEEDGLWHIFFLQADKSLINPDLRHWNVSVGHATSKDLKNWNHLGTCFKPAKSEAWDDKTTWTGSVVKDDNGLWHLFYTGTSEKENGLKQRVGHATSTDLHSWERMGDGLCLDLDDDRYESEHDVENWHDRAMRDPWVMRDPDSDDWLMFFTARVPGIAEANAGGAVGLARSKDLTTWTLEAPIFQGDFGQLEVPQVLSLNGKWYCVFCTSGGHWSKDYTASVPGGQVSGSHYLMADNIMGPWSVAPGKFLDGDNPCPRYAGKLVETDTGLRFMGFTHDTAEGEFIGVIGEPVKVMFEENGLLQLADAIK